MPKFADELRHLNHTSRSPSKGLLAAATGWRYSQANCGCHRPGAIVTTTSSQRAVRGLALLVTAAFLPILLFAGVSALRSLARESEAIEAGALGRGRQLARLGDRRPALQPGLAPCF